MVKDSVRTNRRTVIRSISGGVSAVGIAGLAGCTGSGDGGGGDGGGGNGGDGGGGGDGDGNAGDDGDGDDGGGDEGGGGGDDESGGSSDFPQREIEMVIPYGPGGGTDTYARLVAKHMPKHLPNEVNVVARNVEGGGGVVATNQVYTAEPDGYTIQQGHLESQTMSQLLPSVDVRYDIREFTMLGSPADAARSWHGNTSSIEEYNNWEDLAAGLGSGDVSVASSSRGGSAHVGIMMFGELTGDYSPGDVNFVHYQGFGETVPPLLRGDQDISMCTFSTALQYAQEEDSYSIAFVLMQDHDEFPSQVEFGVPEDVAQRTRNMFTNVRAIWAPPGLPEDRTEILRQAIWDTINDEEFVSEAENAGRPVIPRRGSNVQEAAQNFHTNWSEHISLLEEATG